MDTKDRAVISVAREQVTISKHAVARERVCVNVVTTVRDETLEIPLATEDVSVERVPVGCFVDTPPPVREEDDRTIVPVLEERAVVTTRLFLREELHLVRRRSTQIERPTVTLRTQEARIERLDPSTGGESHE